MINDLIADSITRIRNASMRKLDVAKLMHSKIVESVVKILQEKNYIESYSVIDEGHKKSIKVNLKYGDKGEQVISELKRISKPGRRVYKGYGDLRSFKNGYGTIIVSTSKGVLANDEAYKLGLGGEVLCSIW